MNAYLISAGVTYTQLRAISGQNSESIQIWDSCVSAIIYGGELDQAQKQFETSCRQTPEGENPITTEIKTIVATKFVDRLFTESEPQPLDWPDIARQANDLLQTTPTDDFEQGYWVDVNQAVPPQNLSPDLESLRLSLPEDIGSGLNWSPDKQFFFLVSVFTPYVFTEPPAEEEEPDAANPEVETDTDEKPYLDSYTAALPELRDKEAVALVKARNSVVAAWLWRRFVATTQLAGHEIQISPCSNFTAVQ